MRNLLLMAVLSIVLSSCATKPEMPRIRECYCLVNHDVVFEQDNFVISSSQKERLNQAVENVIKKEKILAFLIVGHSDPSEQNEEKQNQLSVQRAKAISDFVVLMHPELKDAVHFEGKGSNYPVSSDASKNRRADIEIIPSCQSCWDD